MSFANDLEEIANEIRESQGTRKWKPGPLDSLEREVTFEVEQLERLRAVRNGGRQGRDEELREDEKGTRKVRATALSKVPTVCAAIPRANLGVARIRILVARSAFPSRSRERIQFRPRGTPANSTRKGCNVAGSLVLRH